MSYERKYIKYKNKYLKLKELLGGGVGTEGEPSIKTINEVVIPSSVTETGENTFNEEKFINNILNDTIKKNITKNLEDGNVKMTINEYITENLKKYVIITCNGVIDSSNDDLLKILSEYTKIDILIINFTNVDVDDDDEYGIDNSNNKSAFAHIKIDELYFYGPKTINIEDKKKSEIFFGSKIFNSNNIYKKKRYNNIKWNDITFVKSEDPFGTSGRAALTSIKDE
jgi:hypothetical protein